ncbi:hypothetical protein CLIB1423_21S01574 [[Candida] railenensis]|uniref:Uncharacterized protein n=1 Tax=[Candida] railenensis TaxID=45579 RepID=A0A9P0W0J3_9ASCO|nr:hypothetical protein CLIB1423_21S01574 [[Candida] railenensis]
MLRSTVASPLRLSPAVTFTRSLNSNSIYVISIPVTTHRSYIYMNHNKSLLDKTQLNRYPVVAKLENKLVSLATKGWDKMNSSNLTVNKRIIKLVKRLLNTIPYEESCLKSFPSQSTMIREINEESTDKARALIPSQIEEEQIATDQLKPIPFYHPSFQKPSTILSQLHDFRNDARSKHLKYAGLCAIGVPLSLPFALIPVIPNVPGLYLSYRLYCNIKALVGVKHLDYLLERKGIAGNTRNDDVSNTDHVAFERNLYMDSIYKLGNTSKELEVESVQEEERVIITKEIIDTLCSKLELPQLKEDLLKALKQEIAKLEKDMKIKDEIE